MSYGSAKESSGSTPSESSGMSSAPDESSGSSGIIDGGSSSAGSSASSGSSSCTCEFDLTAIAIGELVNEGAFTIRNLGTCTLTGIETEGLGGPIFTTVLISPSELPPGGLADVSVTADGDLRGTDFVIRTSCGEAVFTWPLS